MNCVVFSLRQILLYLPSKTCLKDQRHWCNAFTINPELLIKDRRRRNLAVRWHRVIKEISAELGITLLLVWSPGVQNPADLNSKVHPNIVQILNCDTWRSGHSSYSETFPSKESIIFGTVTDGKLTYTGIEGSATHATSCAYCSTTTETGELISSTLVTQAKLTGTK